MSHDVQKGILVGLCLAVLQATLSVAVLKWVWNKKSFYAAWGIGTLARFVIFGLTAYVVHRHTSLDLASTLISLVLATMLFMIIEVKSFLAPKK